MAFSGVDDGIIAQGSVQFSNALMVSSIRSFLETSLLWLFETISLLLVNKYTEDGSER